MNPACTDATGSNLTNFTTQAGNDHDARKDPDTGESQPAQQSLPKVSVDNDRQTIGHSALFFPPQQELPSPIMPGASPGQLSASQPVLRGPEAAESAHESGDVQTQTASDRCYRSELSAWVESAAPPRRAAHQEAEKRISAYLEKPAEQRQSIDLSQLGLSTLPPLPAGLIALDIKFNKLTVLPENLPQGLRHLDAYDNKLTALPEHLPQSLQRLYVEFNKLTALPQHLPEGLEMLEAGNNKLTVLPKRLPQELQQLDVRCNKLSALPAHLPRGLQALYVSDNKLSALPENLPQGLQKLYASDNNLTALSEHLPQGLQMLCVNNNNLTALPEHLPQNLQELYVGGTNLSALPAHLPQGLQQLDVSNNKLFALPEHLPQGLQELYVGDNKLIALPKNLPQNLKCLSAAASGLNSKTLVALMRSNASITELDVDWYNIDAGSKQVLAAELVNNKDHPARLLEAAVTFDLLTRFGLTTSDQTDPTGTLIKRTPTPNPVAGQLPAQPIPAELHHVLAANCPKDVLAVLAGM